MDFDIRVATEEVDFENYYRICFHLFRDKFYAGSMESEEEIFKKHRDKLQKIDFRSPDNCLYVVYTPDGEFAGAVWVGVRERGDFWDKPGGLPGWVFDVEVDPKFRKQGLGRRLMLQAEAWTREKGISSIGLHTSHDLVVALNLYRSMGYEERTVILRKSLVSQDMTSREIPFGIQKRESNEFDEAFFKLRLDMFRTLIISRSDLSSGEIAKIYPNFKQSLSIDDEAYITFIGTTSDGKFAGAIAGLVSGNAAWIVDVEVSPEFRRNGLGTELLRQVESTFLEKGYESLNVFISLKCDDAVSMFQKMGYMKTNVYMFKNV